MASDKRQFERALEGWQTLRDNHEYSKPFWVGKVAIMVSFAQTSDESTKDSADNFAKEARAFAKMFKRIGIRSYYHR